MDSMGSCQLIRPTSRLEASHASLVAEFLDRGEKLVPWVLAEVGDSFEQYVEMLEGYSKGVGLPEGFLPNTTFWLTDDSEKIVAVSNLRHELNDFLRSFGGHIGFGVRPSARRRGYATEVLRRTLVEARALGIEDVLVTCDKLNTGSVKAIINNGGKLSDEEYMAEHSCVLQRYWIRA